jgi:ketosteroid isomerase-like protein
MSKENVELARARMAAWNAGDMEAFHEFSDPGIIVRPPEGWPEPGPFVGREAVIRQFEQLRETFDADAIEQVSDFIDIGDRVAVRFRWRTVGQGPEAKLEWTVILTVRKGKVLSVDYFWDHSEALEALGLKD